MIKKINKYINTTLISSILLLILGAIMILFPETTLNITSYCIAIISLLLGIYLIIIDINIEKPLFFPNTSLSGIILSILGIILLAHPKSLFILIPIVLGIWFIISSITKINYIQTLKYINKSLWISSIITTILSIICGLIFIINPLRSAAVVTTFFGIIMIIYSICDIYEIIIIKRNVNKIDKEINKRFKIIDEE